MHIKLWHALNLSMLHLFGAQIVKLRFNMTLKRRYKGQQLAGPAGGDATIVVLMRCSINCYGQLWRPRGISSALLVFHKIHCRIMSFEKDEYLNKFPQVITQLTVLQAQTYSDALKYSFSPRTTLHWNRLAPSVVAAETADLAKIWRR